MSGKFMLNGTEYLGGGSGGGGGNVDDVLVNGTTVVDANKKAQIKSYKEITLQEYIALPDTKLTDGIMYAIKDATSESNNYPPLIYSDNEREVGVWRDGKPLYQKTIDCGSFTEDVSKTVLHNISDLDNIISIIGIGKDGNGNMHPVPVVQPSSLIAYQLKCFVSSTSIGLSGESGTNYGLTKIYITLQYTKTTDTPGSGTWTTDGGYAKHYSTDEQIIGTWVDGSTLYEKTKVIPVSSISVTNNIREIPFLETGQVLKRIVYAFANDTTYGDISLGTQTYVSNSNMSNNWGFCRWYGGLAIYTTNTAYWSNLSDITVIYQYTKSSS